MTVCPVTLSNCHSHRWTAGKRHQDKAILRKDSIYLGACLQFQRVSPLSSQCKHGHAEAGMALEPRAYILTHRRQEDTGPGLGFGNLKAHLQWHASSDEATPPNPSNPFREFHSLVMKLSLSECHSSLKEMY